MAFSNFAVITRLRRLAMSWLSGLLLAWLCLPARAPAQIEQAHLEAAARHIDAYMAAAMRFYQTPGAALAVTGRDSLIYAGYFGFADLKMKKPVTSQTLFEIGSISKSFTAIALLQLTETGGLDLNAPLKRYVPDFRVRTNFSPFTVDHLLSHTSGLPRDRDEVPSSIYQMIGLREMRTGYAPGYRFAYSNIGYQVLGYLLANLTGLPYHEVIYRRIFLPLGMSSSVAFITHDIRLRLAVGYVPLYDDRPPSRSTPLVEAPWIEYAGGDGSIATTAPDLAAYARMLLNRGRAGNQRILSDHSFRLLTQRRVKIGENAYYGYGIEISRNQSDEIIGHTGGMIGYSSALSCDADAGIGVVVLLNGPGDPAEIARFVLETMQCAAGSRSAPPAPAIMPPTCTPGAEEYAGIFTTANGEVLRTFAVGDSLYLEYAGNEILLERRQRDAFWVDHPHFALYLLRFHRNPITHQIVEMSYGPDWYRGETYSGPIEFDVPRRWRAYTGHYRTQNPWLSNFRVILRKGKLWFVTPDGGEAPLVELREGYFQIGDDLTAERLSFDVEHDGKFLHANLSGVNFYRTFTP